MGEILCCKRYDADARKMVVEVLLNKEEFRNLGGEIDEIYVFSDRTARVPSKVSLRGRNAATRYFLIPRQLRRRLAIHGQVSCQRFETDEGKAIFVYVLDQFKRARDKIRPEKHVNVG